MEPVQRYFIKFNSSTLDIYSIGKHYTEEAGYTALPVDWSLIEPFFVNFKNMAEYYPMFENGKVSGFRKKRLESSRVVKNSESETLKSIQSFENFIADCEILVKIKDDAIQLIYDQNYFDSIKNQENIDRLTLVKENQYNIHITQKGNPYYLYNTYAVTLNSLLENNPIELPYTGPKDVSVYVTTKN